MIELALNMWAAGYIIGMVIGVLVLLGFVGFFAWAIFAGRRRKD